VTLHHWAHSCLLDSEDEGTVILQNTRNYLPNDSALHHKDLNFQPRSVYRQSAGEISSDLGADGHDDYFLEFWGTLNPVPVGS